MSQLFETCSGCGWAYEAFFQYHGGLPIEHPSCPACGSLIEWSYQFDAMELSIPPEEMESYVGYDPAGFPVDESPAYQTLAERLDAVLEETFGTPLRISNAQGVVDVEIRPYIHKDSAHSGIKFVAHVGRSVYSMGLLEWIARIHEHLSVGTLIAHPNAYGLPHDARALFPFGTPVGMYLQHTLPASSLDDGSWHQIHATFQTHAVTLAHQLASAAKLSFQNAPVVAVDPPISLVEEPDEFVPHSSPVFLEDARQQVLEPLLVDEHPIELLTERIRDFHASLQIDPKFDAQGALHYTLDSARVLVRVEETMGRVLIRYRSTLLSSIELGATREHSVESATHLLATLNDQIVFGKCVLEPLGVEGEDGVEDDDVEIAQIVLEKTLLGIDLDLSEFAMTLVAIAEEADRIDNLLQSGLGGLRADQIEHDAEALTDAAPLEGLVQQIAVHGLDGVERIGVEKGRTLLRHLLEDVRLHADEDDDGDLWFSYGSSRILGQVWANDRATYLTLRATVLEHMATTEGLSKTLNDCNRSIHFGAFALRGESSVEMIETIPIDDLSVEEFIHALVTLGESADLYDNMLQNQFGGELGIPEAPSASLI